MSVIGVAMGDPMGAPMGAATGTIGTIGTIGATGAVLHRLQHGFLTHVIGAGAGLRTGAGVPGSEL
jgi:hypothetical protein